MRKRVDAAAVVVRVVRVVGRVGIMGRKIARGWVAAAGVVAHREVVFVPHAVGGMGLQVL